MWDADLVLQVEFLQQYGDLDTIWRLRRVDVDVCGSSHCEADLVFNLVNWVVLCR